MRSGILSFPLYILSLLHLMTSVHTCPTSCECHQISSGMQVTCLQPEQFRDFPSFEKQLPMGVSEIFVSNQKFVYLNMTSMEKYAKLREFSLNHCRLQAIEAKFFQRMNKIETIVINNNPYNLVAQGHFHDIPSLKVLNLQYNTIQEIEVNAFQGCTSLSYLYFDNNPLSTLHLTSFSGLRDLSQLQLRWLAFTENTRLTLSDSAGLNVLHLGYNSLKRFTPSTLTSSSSLRQLYLYHCALSEVGATALASFPVLAKLDLSNNYLTNLPSASFSVNRQLTSLDLSENFLKEIPLGLFSNLSYIETLKLYGNHLQHLMPETFVGLRYLNDLQLNSNSLTTLPVGIFRDLERLTSLNLEYNNLITLPSTVFEGLVSLTELSLKSNKLRQIDPPLLFPLTKLTDFHISKNHLEGIKSDTFKYQQKLIYTCLDNNRIVEVSKDAFAPLINLVDLKISHNDIDEWPIHSALPNLEIFAINNCKLDSIPSLFHLTPKLESVYLGGNYLSFVYSEAFDGAPLQLIDMNYCLLEEVELFAFTSVSTLRELNFDGNYQLCITREQFNVLNSSLSKFQFPFNTSDYCAGPPVPATEQSTTTAAPSETVLDPEWLATAVLAVLLVVLVPILVVGWRLCRPRKQETAAGEYSYASEVSGCRYQTAHSYADVDSRYASLNAPALPPRDHTHPPGAHLHLSADGYEEPLPIAAGDRPPVSVYLSQK